MSQECGCDLGPGGRDRVVCLSGTCAHETRRGRRFAGGSSGSALRPSVARDQMEKTMKGAIVLAAVIAAIALGACRKDVAHPPMKLGASVNQVAE